MVLAEQKKDKIVNVEYLLCNLKYFSAYLIYNFVDHF